MKIAVIADTHMPRMSRTLPPALVKGLQEEAVDRILHCGDLTEMLVVEALEAVAPVDAVAGNNDSQAIIERFGRRRLLVLEGVRIGLVHGDGPGKTTLERAWDAFSAESVDVILFGHSHQPLLTYRDGVLLLNPGSPTDKRRQPRYSWGLLVIAQQKVRAELRYFDDKR